jgi:hypothetical protein
MEASLLANYFGAGAIRGCRCSDLLARKVEMGWGSWMLPSALLIVQLASSAVAGALDQRGVAIGDTCESALGKELALGTHPKYDLETMRAANALLFEDSSVSGQTTEILYSCSRTPGVISSYAITILVADQASAEMVYVSAKAAIVADLGAPTFDSEKLSATQRQRYLGLHPEVTPRVLSNWNGIQNRAVSVSIYHYDDDRGWRVVTSVSDPIGKSK